MKRDQRIRDPVHNLISFSSQTPEDELLWELIQTPPVQRLRRIKQLGFSEFVYPGATHSRFSHVLGAMQMARRMLDVFERVKVFPAGAAHDKRRKATLAAALLHDVGHGPYSHVFEEISETLGVAQAHEEYTRQIIEQPEIKNILDHHGVFDEVISFFKTEPGYDPYTAIISSQMDCDRLDFLVRDRYNTGLHSAEIDLEWLFDSLRIAEVPIDPLKGIKAYSFVVLPKGISVMEDFLTAYTQMYQKIYFHKATRAVQHMVRDIIMGIFAEQNILTDLKPAFPILEYWATKSSQTVERYLELDDSSIISLVAAVSKKDYGKITKIALRYLRRDLYKCIELPVSKKKQLIPGLTARFIDALRTRGFDYFDDVPPAKSYKQFAVMDPNFLLNIMVMRGGDFEPLGEVSDIADQLPARTYRIYFRNEKQRDEAQEILKACRTS
jgi:HD superfamily phosphohydrolase